MTRDEWRQVKGIAADAFERPEAERAVFVETACTGDSALRHEMDSLLQSMMNGAGSFELRMIAPVPTKHGVPVAGCSSRALPNPRAARARRDERGASRARVACAPRRQELQRRNAPEPPSEVVKIARWAAPVGVDSARGADV